MKILTASEIKEQYQDLILFKYSYDVFERNTKLRDTLSKIFGVKILAAWSDAGEGHDVGYGVKKTSVDISGVAILFINVNGELVYISNSEWCDISIEK